MSISISECSGLRPFVLLVCFDSLPQSTVLVIFERIPVFLGYTITKQRIKRLAQGHNTITLVSLELENLSIPSLTLLRSLHPFVNMTSWVRTLPFVAWIKHRSHIMGTVKPLGRMLGHAFALFLASQWGCILCYLRTVNTLV